MVERRRPEPLTPAQLGALASATLKNSVDLLRDAEGLAVFGRFPRAFSLAVLAAEEFGKHMMCFGAVGRDKVDPEAWTVFWRRFVTHRPKYENTAISLQRTSTQRWPGSSVSDFTNT